MTETKYGPWKIGRWDEENATVQRVDITSLDDDTYAYREVIEPKRETVVRYAEFLAETKQLSGASIEKCPDDNLRLHIPLVDGEIEDGALIRVERL